MTSLLDVRLGEQEPVLLHLPPDVHSLAAAEEAIELADAYGICDGYPLAESQKITLRAALGEREDGSWAATAVADFGPRQGTGKNDKIAARELAGLILYGEQLIIHTAHEFPTANESFLRLVAVFESWDDLRKRVARIRYANGEQGIELLTGQRLKYRARTGGSGRGFAKADLIVYDEAQHLSREHVAASGPAKLANPNSQTWYAGSGGLATSAVAWNLRRHAILGTGGRLAYTEMTGETIEVVDGEIKLAPPVPTDREVWYRAIPGLGRWVTEEGVEALFDELGPELGARELLCVWDPDPEEHGDQVIPYGAWLRCADPTAARGDRVAYAIDAAPDGLSASIAASDGLVSKVLEHGPGTSWVAGKVAQMVVERPGPVFLDPRSPAGALLVDLGEAGVDVQDVSPQQHAQACGGLLAAVTHDGPERRFLHVAQPPLDAAVSGATRRVYGDAWAWSRRTSKVDISPLVAVTLARWGALTLEEDYDVLDSVH
jgi:hypothetical protein